MCCGPRARGLIACVLAAALACVLLLCLEARRRSRTSDWVGLTAGLGIGSQAGVGDGYFAYDLRLESLPEGIFEPLPGSALGAGTGGGVFTCPPVSR